MTFSDVAKYLIMTRSIARYLCDKRVALRNVGMLNSLAAYVQHMVTYTDMHYANE